ncbi:MAG: cell division protein FtsB [Gammaproteobacteria bacterium]
MRFGLILLIILLVWLQFELWVGKGSRTEVRELKQAISLQKEENDQLKERNQALAAEVKDLKSGIEAIEELARSEMGMIKKGETFYQIVDPVKGTSKGDLKDIPKGNP